MDKMRRFIELSIGVLLLAGCAGMKESQWKPYVGDSQTKVYYKNVPDLRDKIPKARRVEFGSTADAEADGYHSVQEGASETPEP
ncbi:MAG: hypothetical protein HYR64_09085 [Fimbriimonas ginsengisoli]|uniref:Uncharacterized protein n=1 Tax=Fimbriimonas ginsengisoli TaxID=1005039 RepID=A0A931PWE7_FIMGI|nr:hypothetical protein [Fimbriimonas ginsengisoli]